MGKIKSWLMDMEQDAAEMSLFLFCRKHGAAHMDVWKSVNDPNYDDGITGREPEEVQNGSIS